MTTTSRVRSNRRHASAYGASSDATKCTIGACFLGLVPVSNSFDVPASSVVQVIVLGVAILALGRQFSGLLRSHRVFSTWLSFVAISAIVTLPTMTGPSQLPSVSYLVRITVFGSAYLLMGVAFERSGPRLGLLQGLLLSSCIVALSKLLGLIEGSGHIEAGRAIGLGLPLIPILMRGQASRPKRIFATTMTLILLSIGGLLTGARGPLVFGLLVLALEVLGTSGISTMRRFHRIGLVVLVCCAAIPLTSMALQSKLFSPVQQRALERQGELLEARSFDDFASGQARLDDVYGPALERISDTFPFGAWLPADANGVGAYEYAHNVFLELTLGLGAIGLLLGALLLLATARAVWKFQPVEICVCGLLLFVLLNSLLSGDLSSNRQLALIIGCAISRPMSAPHRGHLQARS